jgi:branched-chain amino acid transport system substrate-binding protein
MRNLLRAMVFLSTLLLSENGFAVPIQTPSIKSHVASDTDKESDTIKADAATIAHGPSYYASILGTVANLLYDPYSASGKLPSDWKFVLSTNPIHNSDDFKAISVFNSNNNVLIVAIAGTNFVSTSDLIEDLQISTDTIASLAYDGRKADQAAEHYFNRISANLQLLTMLNQPHDIFAAKHAQTLQFINDSKNAVERTIGANGNPTIILTGHSSGGIHAALAGAVLGYTSVTFNAPWIPVTMARRFGISMAADDNAYNFSRAHDPAAVGDILGKGVVPRSHDKMLKEDVVLDPLKLVDPLRQHYLALTMRAAVLDQSDIMFFPGEFDKGLRPDIIPQAGKTVNSDSNSQGRTSKPSDFVTSLISLLFDDLSNTKNDSNNDSSTPPLDPSATPNNQPVDSQVRGQDSFSDPSATPNNLPLESYTYEIQPIESQSNDNNNPVSTNPTKSGDKESAPSIAVPDPEFYTEDQWIDRNVQGLVAEQTAFFEKYLKDNPPNGDPLPPGVTDPDSKTVRDGVFVTTIGGQPVQLKLDKPDVDPWPTDFRNTFGQTKEIKLPPAVDPVPPGVKDAPVPAPPIRIRPLTLVSSQTPPAQLIYPAQPEMTQTPGGGSGGLVVGDDIALGGIGVAGPITGPNAAFGAQLVNGTLQAVDDIDKAGGILGQQIILEQGDDVSDPKQGVSVANKFVGDRVKFVVGHFSSGVTIPVSDVYQENGILMITPSATNPKVTDRSLWNVFRTCGRDDEQGILWAEYARDHLKGKRIAVVHDGTTYGEGLADAALNSMHKFGIKEVLYEGVIPGEKDYLGIVLRIKEFHADYLMWGGLHTEGGLIIREMRDLGMNTVMISGDGISDNEFARIGGPGVEGTMMTFEPDPRNNPAAKDVVAEFKAKNFDPEAYTLYSYAAVQILKQAVEKAKSADPKKVAEVMHSGMTFNTVIGPILYDKKGDRTNYDYVWYVWKRGSDGQINFAQSPVASGPGDWTGRPVDPRCPRC